MHYRRNSTICCNKNNNLTLDLREWQQVDYRNIHIAGSLFIFLKSQNKKMILKFIENALRSRSRKIRDLEQ